MIDATVYRWHVATAHSAVILWQVYVAITAFRSGDILANLMQGIGAETGGGVSLFLVTHRWWLIVPIIFAILAGMALRRIETNPRFSVIILGTEVIVALALNIWWREACFGPIFSLIKQVG